MGQPTQFSEGYSWRAYTGTTAPLCLAPGGTGNLCHYYPTNSFESAYQEFAAWRSPTGNAENATDFMNFRVAFPLNYNQSRPEPYPVILMLHGAGESGRIWSGNFDYPPSDPRYDNNSRNLLHGGNVHQQAANRNPTHPQAFPGIIIFPQVSFSGSWASGWQENPTTNQEFIYEFLEYMVTNYNANINRIYVHGLSNGGRGTWDTATKRPDLFAAVLPMSGLPYNSDVAAERLETTPIRLYQGGRDTNPSPGGSESMISKLVANGGTPEYKLYPTLAHGVWNTAYGEADFWSWMLSKDKRNIYVFGGSTELCLNATKKLGFSYGYLAYRWKKDGAVIPGETTRYLTITGTGNYTGLYTVEFQRPNEPGVWYESFPVNITAPQGGGSNPLLEVMGSLILPYTKEDGTSIGSIGQTETRLIAPSGYSQYQWFRNGILQGTTTVNNAKITHGNGSSSSGVINNQIASVNAGNWTVRVLEGSGCWSNHSNTKTLVYNSGSLTPCNPCHSSPTGGTVLQSNELYFDRISIPTVTPQSINSILVTWTETIPDEEYFEIWRYRRSGGEPNYPSQANFVMISTVPANTTEFVDNIGLRPYAEYQYSIRAIGNNDGRFSRKSSTAPWPRTLEDLQAPTPPTQLTVADITETSVTISWGASQDNDVVYAYELFAGGTLVATLTETPPNGDATDGNPHPPTFYTFTGLDPGTTYMLNVRARDFRGNYSIFPQALIATTNGATNGLSYKYYTTTGLSGTNTNPNQLAEPYTTVNGPNFNFSTATPNQIGITSNPNNAISIAHAIQGTTGNGADNFVFAFDGYIQIDVAGNYRFYTSSDDGSRLYINGNLLINNDGAQGTTTESGVVNLGVGKHAIRITYFENGGGNVFVVRYNGPTAGTPPNNFGSAIALPDDKLFLTNTTFTNYYSKATGDLDQLSTWGRNTDGTGTAPPNFTNNYQIFNIANRSSATLSNPWTVTGASSRVVVDNNITLTLNEALNAKVYANTGSTINLNHASLPNLSQLHATSTVNMNVTGTVPLAVYGNLNLNIGATTKTLPVSSTLVNGNLNVGDQVIFKGSASPDRSTLLVAGDITFQGNSSAPPAVAERYSLIFDGDHAHTISVNQTDISLAALEVEGSLNLNFNDASVHTLNVGVANSSGGLLLKAGSTLNLGNHNLVVNGTYGVNPTDDSGEININGGSITVNTASQLTSSLYFSDELNTHNVLNLVLTNTGAGQINLLGPTKLANLMTVGAGTVNMQGDFVLRSTSDAGTGTARIGPMNNGARITGNITAERYMSGEGRIYRYISSPVQNATAAQLQEWFPITGNFSGSSVIQGVTSGASMFQYTEPNYTQFPAVGGTNQQILETGRGYAAFIRQDVDSTVWKVTGEPNQGTIPFTLTGGTGDPGDGWNLLGNPYPAPIQWTGGSSGGWSMTGVNNTVYIRENSNSIEGGFAWQQHNGSTGTFNGIIAPGQAFWVRTTTTASPSLIIGENAKVVTDGAFFREGAAENTIEVSMRSANSQDATFIQFKEGASAAFDTNLDGVKQSNSFFNLSTLTTDQKAMAINLTTPDYCVQEIKLRTDNAAAGTYTLEINGVASLLSRDKVTLIDNFLDTETIITDSETLSFSITSDPASKADGRFTLRFEKPEVRQDMILSSTAACEQNSPVIHITNAQPGVEYQAFSGGNAISAGLVAQGNILDLPVQASAIAYGISTSTLKAGFRGCNSFDLEQTVAVQRDTLEIPLVIQEHNQLVASIDNAQYTWYKDSIAVEALTSRIIEPTENGTYFVSVTKGTCTKVSEPIVFVITSLENSRHDSKPYPNPTRNKVIITLSQPIVLSSVRTYSAVGVEVLAPVSLITDRSAEVDLGGLPSGMFMLKVNGRLFKVIKE